MTRHRTDVVSLLFGLLFIALAGWWAVAYYLGWTLDWNVPNFGWFAAGVLIVVGLFGVVASLRRDRPEPALAQGSKSFDMQPSAQPAPTTAETVNDDPGPQDTGPPTVDLGPGESTPTDVRPEERD
jgi:hypothetical protein